MGYAGGTLLTERHSCCCFVCSNLICHNLFGVMLTAVCLRINNTRLRLEVHSASLGGGLGHGETKLRVSGTTTSST